MGALDELVRHNLRRREQNEFGNFATNFVNTFLATREQRRQEDLLQQQRDEQTDIRLAVAGIRRTPGGGFERDPSLRTKAEEIIELSQLAEAGKQLRSPELVRGARAGLTELISGKKQRTQAPTQQGPVQTLPSPQTAQTATTPVAPGNLLQEGQQQEFERDVFGELTPRGEQQKARAAGQAEIEKQVGAQSAKAAELAQRDFLRASAAADTSFDEALSFGEQQLKNFNLRPGQFFGIVDKLTPSEFNRFKDAFTGAGREAAALIARQIIPGVRAASITRIFAQSAAKLGSTMESNANNVASSMGNAFANVLSQNVEVLDSNGNKVKIQDLTLDPATGRPLSQLGIRERSRAINDLKRQFRVQLSNDYLQRAFKRNPEILKPETRRTIVQNLPSYRTEADGDANELPGRLYLVGTTVFESTGRTGGK